MNKDTIFEKIELLFEYRKIPWLIELAAPANEPELMQKLVDLQVAIYNLDSFLESNWELNSSVLKPFWVDIDQHLRSFGLSEYQIKSWAKEIRTYEERELALRLRRSPLEHSIDDLYYFKSCDVRLMRRLIYRASTDLKLAIRYTDWTEFDLLTEVNDDVEDLIEDLESLNGNRFLFSLFEKGEKNTLKIYIDFIRQNLRAAQARFGKSNLPYAEIMYGSVIKIGSDTLELLDDTMRKIGAVEYKNCKILQKYRSLI